MFFLGLLFYDLNDAEPIELEPPCALPPLHSLALTVFSILPEHTGVALSLATVVILRNTAVG